jgi:hypothetical protein
MVKKYQIKSLNIMVVFIIIFLSLISISILCKIINVFQKSVFDSENLFTVSVIGKTNDVSLVSFSPKTDSIYILNVKNGKNKNLRSVLEVPIDNEIYQGSEINEDNVKTNFLKYIVPFTGKKTNLTIVDLFKLWLYANSVPTNSIYEQEISTGDDVLAIKKLGIYSYFVDQGIAEEKKTIEVINGTDVFGLGNKLASFLSNMGVNVVMVSTADNLEGKSRIDYFGQESYTLKKLSRALGFKVSKTNKKSLGDITIIIGKDALSHLGF